MVRGGRRGGLWRRGPKGWESQRVRALRGRGRRWRERWFSRRGAVSATVNTGRAQTRARHDRGRVGERPVAGGGGQFGWRYADIAGVQSPPLRGGERRTDGLAGETRG
jgi:hypothetical protein